MTIDGEVFDPFSAETLAILPPTQSSCKKEIIEQNRRKYSLSLIEVKEAAEKEKETEKKENSVDEEKNQKQEIKEQETKEFTEPLL